MLPAVRPGKRRAGCGEGRAWGLGEPDQCYSARDPCGFTKVSDPRPPPPTLGEPPRRAPSAHPHAHTYTHGRDPGPGLRRLHGAPRVLGPKEGLQKEEVPVCRGSQGADRASQGGGGPAGLRTVLGPHLHRGLFAENAAPTPAAAEGPGLKGSGARRTTFARETVGKTTRDFGGEGVARPHRLHHTLDLTLPNTDPSAQGLADPAPAEDRRGPPGGPGHPPTAALPAPGRGSTQRRAPG